MGKKTISKSIPARMLSYVPFSDVVPVLFNYWIYSVIFLGYSIALMMGNVTHTNYMALLFISLPVLFLSSYLLSCVTKGGCVPASFLILSLVHGGLITMIIVINS